MIKKLLALILCAGLMLMYMPQPVKALDDYTYDFSYIDENGDEQMAYGVTPIAADTTTLSGWYVVNSNVTCDATITVSGDAKLILADGFTLTVNGSSNNAGINVSNGNSLTIYAQAGGTGTLNAQGGPYGAGIGGGKAQSCGAVTIHGGNVTATGGTGGAGIGGGMGSTGSNASYGVGGTGGSGGAGGAVTIYDGVVTAIGNGGGAGIGGGIGGTGGRGSSGIGGYDGGKGGSGGAGGTVIINGGIVQLSGSSFVKINGGSGGNGGGGGLNGDQYYGKGGKGGSGGNGGTVIINDGTVTPTGSGIGTGIGGGMGGTGGRAGDGSAGSDSSYGPKGATGPTGGISDCVITGGSVNAQIGCIPTTGGATPVNAYPTVVCLSDAADKDVNALAISQNGSALDYDFKDMKTDANGKLYLYLPAFDGDTTAAITAGGHIYNGYHGHLKSTATYTSPNVLKMDQDVLTFTNTDICTFTYDDAWILGISVTGGTLSGTVQYTYSGTDFSTGMTLSDSADMSDNAGNYTIKATLPGNDLYHDAIATKGFIINPRSMDGFAVSDISTKTYTGENFTPSVIVRDGAKTLTNGTDYTVTYINNKNVGTATATIVGRGNYTGSLTKDFSIAPKDISLTLSAVPNEAKAGSDVVLTASVLGAVDLPAGKVTFEYDDTVIAQDVPVNADGSAYSAVTTWNSVPAGEYDLTATYTAAASDNYTCVSNGAISSFSITKHDQPDFMFTDGTGYSISEGTISKTYGDSAFTLQVSGKLSTSPVSYAVTSGGDVATVNAVSGEITILKSGTAVITATSPTDAMYNEATAAVTIEVAKADQSGFGFAEPSVSKTYGDAPFTVSALGGESSGAVTYAVTDGSDVVTVDAVTGEVTVLKSGTAVVTATKAADDYYREATSQITINVAKADQGGFGFAESAIYKTYSATPFTITPFGSLSANVITYAVTYGSDVATVNETSGEITLLKSGIATIAATSPTDDKYNEATAQMTVHVAKANQSEFGFPKSSVSKTYGDAPFVISPLGRLSSGKLTYTVTSGSDVVTVDETSGQVTIHKAGKAVVKAAIAADDCYNSAASSLTINVSKAVSSIITPPTAADIPVVGLLSAITLSGGESSVPGSFSWTNPNGIVSATGMYEVTFTPEDTVNYAVSTCEVNVKVTPVISNTGIEYDFSKADLPDGVTSVSVAMSAEPTADTGGSVFSVLSDKVDNADQTGNVLAIYDLNLLDQNGNPVTNFTGAITVRIPVPDGMTGDLRVVWYDPAAGTVTDMNARLESGYLVFETTHFSYYAVVQMTKPAYSSDDLPQLGGGDITIVYGLLGLFGLALACCIMIVRRNKARNQ